MSLGSLPVIKNLVSRSRRERVPLTTEMISPPLGDFRHTMHVGRKGEVFGDTSFLSNCHEKHRHTRWNYITKKLRQARWMSPEPQSQGHPIFPPPPVSPIIKNSVSLPVISMHHWDEETDGSPGEAWNSMAESHSHYGLESGFCTMPRLSSSEDPSEDTNSQKPEEDWASSGLPYTEESSVCTVPLESFGSLYHADSMQSLVMDFGPSLMTEILEGISFSDTPKKTEEASVLQEQNTLSSNHSLSNFNVTLDQRKPEAHQFHCDVQGPKGLVSWEPTTIAEEMEIDTDSGITGSEQGSRGITGDLYDSGDGSEIEM
ncbi:cdc42 effector protein 1 [Hyla sarda]|uniref:cdc42 effector protein 1 n=1 Tax=Hyla sarda TaxID=327740 RepID=UPI0024C36F00|nr:cdc42 effector protein 1 [Hyla sarda]XP_056380107.1 cdc42 effector protein 1 [Hyla sarda]XP_056380108.1 cdc42 effector protein 1 [Hyla sarda]